MTDTLKRDFRALTITADSLDELKKGLKALPGYSVEEISNDELVVQSNDRNVAIYLRGYNENSTHLMTSNVIGIDDSKGQDHEPTEPSFKNDEVVKLAKSILANPDTGLSASYHLTESDIERLESEPAESVA